MSKMYTYHDFETNKIKRTRGEFICWTLPDGCGERRALFRNPKSSSLRIPERLPPCPQDILDS